METDLTLNTAATLHKRQRQQRCPLVLGSAKRSLRVRGPKATVCLVEAAGATGCRIIWGRSRA